MEKTVLCIVRASTEHQETESQKKELIDYCLGLGFRLGELDFIEVAGASARKLNKKYVQMLEDIKQRLEDSPTLNAVALWDLNRLGRVESKLHEMKEWFVSHHIQVYCKSPAFMLFNEDGTVNDSAGIVFSVFAAMVKHDTDEMFAKMERGGNRNREKGMYIGGRVMFGYEVGKDKRFYINQEEAETIRSIFETYASRKYSIRSLTDELNARGLTLRGRGMTYDLIQGILANKSYYSGKMPLISEELFRMCSIIKNETIAVLRTRESRNVNFAVGLLRCKCGCNFIASGSVYTCFSKVRRSGNKCNAPTVRRDVIDRLLWLVVKRLYHASLINDTSHNIREYEAQQWAANKKIDVCRDEIARIKERIDKLQDDFYIEGGMSDAQFKKRQEALLVKIKQQEDLICINKRKSEEADRMIKSLSRSNVYADTLAIYEMDEEDEETKKRIKELMFDHIRNVLIEKGDRSLIIHIQSMYNGEFPFLYNIWLNTYRKGECCIFYDDLPLYSVNDGCVILNDNVIRKIEDQAGLPSISNEELGAAIRG